jgi:class 3 adenylate cyclase/tetratricopeptide (TPR) repeat protein
VGAERCPQCGAELPQEARFCAYCGVTIELTGAKASPREERRVITALFADLAGSTQLGERLDPEDFRDLTGGALARMGAAIEELGGTVRGTAGDGVLGLFGAPTAHEDDAERAVIAGLRLVERMREYGSEAAERWDVADLRVRVGIETGLAVLGEVRAGSQVQYDASGDCLNTAARLEGAADTDGVLVGPLTHRLVSEAFDWGEPRPLALKGKAESVLARHALTTRGDRPAQGRGSGSRLVGRDRELALAAGIVAEATARNPRIVIVTGEAGIGKTRFMRELRSLFVAAGRDGPTPTWLEGTCLSYGMDEPYLPFRQVVRQALGRGVDSTAEVREALTALVGSQRADDAAPMLGMILGLAPETNDSTRMAALSAESLQQAVIDSFVELVTGWSARGAVAISLDDLHWADAASLRLAEGLLTELTDEIPVLLVLAMRSESDRPAWALRERILEGHPQRATELRLASLDRDAERGLVSDLVGRGTLPQDLESLLLQRAEGNPFYLGELLRSLRDTGAIVKTAGRWTFDRDVPFELPETVERVVLARIDRLPSGDRDLLNSAAVIGREFELALLGRIAGADLSPASLSNLARLGLIEAASGAAYRFSHPMIQETAYSSMLRRGRAELHGRAAAAIEELAEDGSNEHHAALARHHSAAGHVPDAVKYHRLAAITAQRVFALEEAVNQFDSALAAADTLDADSARVQLPELYLLRGRARGRNGDFAGGEDDFRQALAEARKSGDGQVEMQALTDLGWMIRVHDYEEAIRLHQQALRKAEELKDPTTQVTALSRLSMMYSNRLQLDHGHELAQRALEIARTTGQDQLLGTALDCLKFAALSLGDLELLDRTVAEIVEVQARTGDLYLVMWAYIEAATGPLARGDLDHAQELIEKAVEINVRFGVDRLTRSMILEARSWIDRARGDLDAAVSAMHEALEWIGEVITPEWSAWLEASMGSHLIEQGNARDAVPVLESALENSETIKSPNRAFRAASHLAWARWLVRDVDESRVALTRAERVLATITAPPGDVFLDGYRSYLAIARTRAALDDAPGAEAVLAPLLAALRQHGWRDAEGEVSDLLAVVRGEAPGQANGRDDAAPRDPAR